VLLEDLISKALMHKGFAWWKPCRSADVFRPKNKIGGASTLSTGQGSDNQCEGRGSPAARKARGRFSSASFTALRKGIYAAVLEIIAKVQRANPTHAQNKGVSGCELNSD
jgi:hypothetical protein